MKIYTKKGDQGLTGLLGANAISKSDIRVEAYGAVDELNAWVGFLTDDIQDGHRKKLMVAIQNQLFIVGSLLATKTEKKIANFPELEEEDVTVLENEMDEMEKKLPEMKNFILPGGHPLVSKCHLIRTVCRRAERRVVALHGKEPVPLLIIQYLNRLSDYFFVLARAIGKEHGVEEIVWKPKPKK